MTPFYLFALALTPATALTTVRVPAGAVRIHSAQQKFSRGAECTGDGLWAGGMCLLNWLCEPDHRHLFEEQSVLELGSGTGALGLGLAIEGARRVTLTDLERQVPLLTSNICANGHAARSTSASTLRWGERLQGAVAQGHDLIVGSDLTYSEDTLEPLASTTAQLLDTREHSTAIFALSRHRAYSHVPDHAHHFIHDLLVARYGMHAALIGSVDNPAAVLGKDFFVGAQEMEGSMPISIFEVATARTAHRASAPGSSFFSA